MAIPVLHNMATLPQHVGHDFGLSAAVPLDQPRIDHFAECTGDDQWIHVDVERARTQSPLGGTIAHGLLSLSLIPAAHYGLGVYPDDAINVLNYGFDKVRFLAPVPAGTRGAGSCRTGRGRGQGQRPHAGALPQHGHRRRRARAAADGGRIAGDGDVMSSAVQSRKKVAVKPRGRQGAGRQGLGPRSPAGAAGGGARRRTRWCAPTCSASRCG